MTKEKIEAHVRKLVGKNRLKFGCELLRLDCDIMYRVITDFGFGADTNSVWVASPVRGSFGITWKNTDEVKKSVLEDTRGEKWKIIGSPLTLSDYLYCLWEETPEDMPMHLVPNGELYSEDKHLMTFNEDGHPTTEADWEMLGELLGLSNVTGVE